MTLPAAAPPVDRLNLTPRQRELIVEAASRLVYASVACEKVELADSLLAGLGNLQVAGAFVCLKRGRHLRGCCGTFGQSIPLLRALAEAADRTVWEDVRFPPVSPSELASLQVEVWLLFGFRRIIEEGEDRAAAVTVGRHGLQVIRGAARGLLLPGVAVDHGWHPERFLDQVCIKAGLHPTAWRDPGTVLFTFEGESVRGRLGLSNRTGRLDREPPVPIEQLPALADFCRRNLARLLSGATPDYFLPGIADGNVAGLVLTVFRPKERPLTLGKFGIRGNLPLQSTLFTLLESAARMLAGKFTPGDTGSLDVGLALFHDPAMHGTADDPDLSGMETGRRALLVMERSRLSLRFDPARPPQELLNDARRQARLTRPHHGQVYSLETVATSPQLTFTTAPRPLTGTPVRNPAVAGRFYPADKNELSALVDNLLDGERRPEPWAAAMVPHAGLIYSGWVAAAVFRRLLIPRTVIIIGPKHTPHGMDWAVAPNRTWALPGVNLESDYRLACQLTRAIAGLDLDAAAHRQEHAIEIELPFFARLAPQSRVVGIVVGSGDLDSARRFARGLAEVVRHMPERPLLLISSDMNHYATDAENRRLDRMAVEALKTLDPARVYQTVTENDISMCGVLPAVIVLETLRLLGRATAAELAGYATSAEVSGDSRRVVGYAGMLFR